MEAIRERYRRQESADIDTLLAAKSREQESETVRLQQELSVMLRRREEELEQIIGKLREEADWKSKQLEEMNRDYESLVSAHRKIEQQFNNDVASIVNKQAEGLDIFGWEYVLPPCKSPKKAIAKFVRDPFCMSLAALLLREVYLSWREGEYESSDELIRLGLRLLVSTAMGIAALWLLHPHGAKTLPLPGLSVLTIKSWTRPGAFAILVVDVGSSSIEEFFQRELTVFGGELFAFVNRMRRNRAETLIIFTAICVWAAFRERILQRPRKKRGARSEDSPLYELPRMGGPPLH